MLTNLLPGLAFGFSEASIVQLRRHLGELQSNSIDWTKVRISESEWPTKIKFALNVSFQRYYQVYQRQR